MPFPLPPEHMKIIVGLIPDDFGRVGKMLFDDLLKYGYPSQEEWMLDLGCGCGRLTRPLASYLSPLAKYVGIDSNAEMVKWCTDNITPVLPNFTFIHMDVKHNKYSPQGALLETQALLPINDASISFAVVISLFTHMLREGTEHYLAELARVLWPGAKLYCTYWLSDSDSADAERVKFPFKSGECKIGNDAMPEDSVLHEKSWLLGLYEKLGFEPNPVIVRGGWVKDAQGRGTQDIVIAVKKNDHEEPYLEGHPADMSPESPECLGRVGERLS